MFLWAEFLLWSAACNIETTAATASIYEKILWYVFDLIYVAWCRDLKLKFVWRPNVEL